MEREEFTFDKPREACGVFGIYAPGEDVATLAYMGGIALQHRGQDAAGIAVWDGEFLFGYKETGLVSDVFDEVTLDSLKPAIAAIAHTRYGTSGGSELNDAQPITKKGPNGKGFALAHNGHLAYGLPPLPGQITDTEWFADKVAERWNEGADLPQALVDTAHRVEGAYSLTVLTHDQLIAMRDPHGFRPLELGKMENEEAYVVASESAALKLVEATHIREIKPGEMIIVDREGVRSQQFAEPNPKLCAFEHVYFARPDSRVGGQSVYETRFEMGKYLAEQSEVEADLVVGVPDSGMAAAEGFAEASGISMRQAIVKNRYITRTFIKSTQADREAAVRIKLSPLEDLIEGNRLVVIDDSIVRGTTTRTLVKMLREAGASEVHMRVSSPPYAWPCFYGMDTGRPEELLANRMSEDEIAAYLGVDSLDYLSIENLQKAISRPMGSLCMACLDGNYPTSIPTPFPFRKNVVNE